MALSEEARAYIDKQEADMKAVAETLSARIEAAGPDLESHVAWGLPCWKGHERIFSVIAHKKHCNLQLWYGSQLAGHSKRIEGTGKALRHVKVRSVGEVDEEIDEIIRAAIALDRIDPQKVR